MTLRVLIVDDSMVFRSQIKAALVKAKFAVVGSVANGQKALEFLENNEVDVMTLDLEMPVMDGLATLKELKKNPKRPNVIVFAANSTRGARTTFDALGLGAKDVVTKPQNQEGASIQDAIQKITEDLIPKVAQFGDSDLAKQLAAGINTRGTGTPIAATPRAVTARPTSIIAKDLHTFLPNIIVIGSSTGGPMTLETILEKLPNNRSLPIIIAQHMPENFTGIFAQRLGDISGWPTQEAKQDLVLEPGHMYVAPGDYHTVLKERDGQVTTTLNKGEKRNFVRPSADYLFESAAAIYGPKVMGFVVTGMGDDGKDGAIAIKKALGGIMIQDKESSVVWGMPGAVYESGCYDAMGDVAACRNMLMGLINRRRAA